MSLPKFRYNMVPPKYSTSIYNCGKPLQTLPSIAITDVTVGSGNHFQCSSSLDFICDSLHLHIDLINIHLQKNIGGIFQLDSELVFILLKLVHSFQDQRIH